MRNGIVGNSGQYINYINSILSTRGRFNVDGYKERHHIIPKCVGGTNDETNLIDLTASEHFIAHKLLCEDNPSHRGLAKAWLMMCTMQSDNQERISITAEEYAEIKEHLAKTKVTDITKRKISEANKGNTAWNKGLTKEVDDRVLKYAQNLSRSLIENNTKKGENNSQYGNIGRITGDENPMCKQEARNKVSLHMKTNNPMKDPEVAKRAHSKLKGRSTHNSKKVLCVETGVVYESISKAMTDMNVGTALYSAVKTGKLAYGYHWKVV